MNRKGTS